MEVLEHGVAVAHDLLEGVPWAAFHHGEVVLAPEVREVDRREDPLELEPRGTSVALVLERDGVRQWWLLGGPFGGPETVLHDPAGRGFATFEQWLDFRVATAHGEQPAPTVTFAADGTLAVTDGGATLLAQRTGLDLGPGYVGDRTGVAKVQHRGVVWYVLAREVAGVTECLPAISDATTIEEFLDEARRWC
ncbi:hypothetical protein [Nocardioides caldifontis]|uniref:hypothetical protein n=1 Tax=Nocardioides caldifontis TaxID=2588938 RepID=UPI0011DF3D79|nr:hypothetical protein [Nocardioides caldifontis]